MVDNQGEDAAVAVRFYGSDGSDWREIFAEERSFQGHSHIHAYFRIFHLPVLHRKTGAGAGGTGGMGGRSAPAPTEQGQLLFLEP